MEDYYAVNSTAAAKLCFGRLVGGVVRVDVDSKWYLHEPAMAVDHKCRVAGFYR